MLQTNNEGRINVVPFFLWYSKNVDYALRKDNDKTYVEFENGTTEAILQNKYMMLMIKDLPLFLFLAYLLKSSHFYISDWLIFAGVFSYLSLGVYILIKKTQFLLPYMLFLSIMLFSGVFTGHAIAFESAISMSMRLLLIFVLVYDIFETWDSDYYYLKDFHKEYIFKRKEKKRFSLKLGGIFIRIKK